MSQHFQVSIKVNLFSLSRLFLSNLKDIKYIFSLLRRLVIKYGLGAELQPEVSHLEWSIAGCEMSAKQVESSPFFPKLFIL